jgi:hypothetical protein
VNRLLRYPQFDPTVARWARGVLKRGELAQRQSELLGQLIIHKLPPEGKLMPTSAVLWGIYYSNATFDIKRKLLVDRCARSTLFQSVHDAIKIANRLGLPEVLTVIRGRLAWQQSTVGP